MKFLKRFRHGLCKLAVLAVVCTLLIGILAVNALTKNSNYLLLDFTPGNTECDLRLLGLYQ